MSDIERINEENYEAKMPDNEANERSNIEKPKKPRTQKQMEAFAKVQEKRKQNIEIKKSGKVEAKQIESVIQKVVEKDFPPAETKIKKYKEIIEPQPESDSEEEIIIKRKPKKQEVIKKKKKQIVIELSDSDSGSSSGSEEEDIDYKPVKHVKSKPKFDSQQHKKYATHHQPKPQPNYFCD